jgi:hypothetical protein
MLSHSLWKRGSTSYHGTPKLGVINHPTWSSDKKEVKQITKAEARHDSKWWTHRALMGQVRRVPCFKCRVKNKW